MLRRVCAQHCLQNHLTSQVERDSIAASILRLYQSGVADEKQLADLLTQPEERWLRQA